MRMERSADAISRPELANSRSSTTRPPRTSPTSKSAILVRNNLDRSHSNWRFSEKCAEIENLNESHQQRVQIMNKFVADLSEKVKGQNVVSAFVEDDDKKFVFCTAYMDEYKEDLIVGNLK